MSHLLEGAELQTDGSIFYMAEAEWMSTPGFRDMDGAAKALYDAHIDFDILPLDALEKAKVENRKLMVNGHAHRFLVIPYAERYPQKLHRLVQAFTGKGLPVFWLTEGGTIRPMGGEALDLGCLAAVVRERGLAHLYTTEAPYLRIGHFVRGETSWFMLFWEGVQGEVDEVIELPCKGDFLRLNLLHGKISRGFTVDGRVQVRLVPYRSELLLFDAFPETVLEGFSPRTEWKELDAPALVWDIELLEQGKEELFRKVKEQSELFSITGKEGWPRFSGRMRYRTQLRLGNDANVALDLGRVGVTAKLTVNGRDLGMRICPPYRWDISEAARAGSNLIEVEVCNTLVHRIQDGLSSYMQIPPSGLLGPVRLYGKESMEGR
nr:glycosylhydrolase-like jelly roll fold domain-containing protein [uncultured Acetatifactor sp.]